ncbi:hypothetical protein GXW83_19950 [Streptacidiphilus sp. PB12-B1b]|uniref:hypothetical protein n=1 Tax=Streptacidiphilus sp. PB12-B1b TaxID=2705012 RepID=UPI0015F89234|nr:hypothetical protein [Streptacidiphilus sp. PB12-B1b]QMU77628.1 hypothetical protein GXW83_19950 [Streptacidiphilus sp. PB12-B1b]
MSRSLTASQHRWIYLGSILLLVALLVVGLLTFHQVRVSNQANDKARQLSAELEAAGFPVPDQREITDTLGTDGGSVCQDPSGGLRQAQWKDAMVNGAAGPGQRPVLADADVVRAEALVLSVYCPDQLSDFQTKIADLHLDNTARE